MGKKNEIREIRNMTNLSRAAFSRKFNIPIRTLENWELREEDGHYPDYIPTLLSRCVEQKLYVLPITEVSMKSVRESSKLSREAFSRKYNIPLRTIEDWEYNKRACPKYVFDLIAWCVKYDGLPPYYFLAKKICPDQDEKMFTSGGTWLIHSQKWIVFTPDTIIEEFGYLTESACKRAITAFKKTQVSLKCIPYMVKKDDLLEIMSQIELPTLPDEDVALINVLKEKALGIDASDFDTD